MISILKTIRSYYFIFSLVLFSLPLVVFAQDSLSLSVSPTLFEMTANPSQQWDSNVRIINSNPYDITVYADVVNFSPLGEGGQAKFQPINSEFSEGLTLAEWINFKNKEFVVPAEKTLEIPFSILVPKEASPGGHFAALLIGTKPPELDEGTSKLQTSQIVTSLIFLRVTGDVIEEGAIREFRSIKNLVEKPEVSFELRFENKGNVHLLPQGEIKITNMWGQERGIIPVNRQLLFGNVLPDQIRKYSFTWAGEWSFADIGRYKAVATLAYGLDSKKFSDMETSFWVIPWKIALIVILVVVGFISLITWAIKIYIKKVLTMSGVTEDGTLIQKNKSAKQNRKVSVTAPIGEGILDLSNRFKTSETWSQKLSSIFSFVYRYKIFFFMLALTITFVLLLVLFVQKASVDKRAYEITIDTNGADIKLSSEQVEYDELKSKQKTIDIVESNKDLPSIKLVNRSGVNGLAAEMRIDLEAKGFEIAQLTTDLREAQRNTVIVYHPKYEESALELSKYITDSLLSSYQDAPLAEPIVIYLGQDYESVVQ